MIRSIKSILNTGIVFLALFITETSTSCNKGNNQYVPDVIKRYPVCANGGIVDSFHYICLCPLGYEDTTCEVESRPKFIGNWSVSEKGSRSGAAQYAVNIQAGTNIYDVVIRNFNNYFLNPIKGYVSRDTIYILSQADQGKQVFGMGYIYSDLTGGKNGRIFLSYVVTNSITTLVNDYGYFSNDGSNPSLWSK